MLDLLVTCYLFLGGSGAGACFVAAVLGLLSPRECAQSAYAPLYRTLIAPMFAVSAAALALGVLCLAADLGRIDRLLLLVTSPVFSYIAVGAYALAATLALSCALALVWARVAHRGLSSARFAGAPAGSALRTVLQVAALPTSFSTMAYTGLLLQSVSAVPLWATPWLPVLFVISSLSCGIALAVATAAFTGAVDAFSRTLSRLMRIDALLLLAEGIVATLVVASAWLGGSPGVLAPPLGGQTSQAAIASAHSLLTGELAPVFLVVFAFVGLAVPLALELATTVLAPRCSKSSHDALSNACCGALRLRASAMLVVALCVLAGGLALRFCLVEAGLSPSLVISADIALGAM